MGRLAFAIVAILIQLFWLVGLLSRLGQAFPWVNGIITVAAIAIALAIYSRKMNAAMKLPWMMLIIVLPVLGIVLYALIGLNGATRRMKKRFTIIDRQLFPLMPQDGQVLETLDEKDRIQANQSRYLLFHMGYPVYQETDIRYFPWALEGLEAQLADLKQVKDFIFMEYHAIEDAESFAMIYRILRQKATEGLDVRLFYDDMGSIGFINKEFRKKMEAQGIQCRVFNPMEPVINVFMNHRDHRKMTIIDGKVGFVGGYNLANEYFNVTHPYGIWKDTGMRLEGKALQVFFPSSQPWLPPLYLHPLLLHRTFYPHHALYMFWSGQILPTCVLPYLQLCIPVCVFFHHVPLLYVLPSAEISWMALTMLLRPFCR